MTTGPTAAPRWLGGFGELVESGGNAPAAAASPAREGWVFDQFGVLHDGRRPYPGAVEVLRRLTARGDAVMVLSNSGKRSAANQARLAQHGFDERCYGALLTSGELAHQRLAQRDDPFYAALGAHCLLISNDGDRSVLQGLPITVVDQAEQASFVLLTGVGGARSVNAYDTLFQRAVARGLPALCANPDLLRLDHGDLVPSCGALARRYEALGGQVRWIGKPYAEVFDACRQTLQRAGCQRLTMVGDSLDHDIAGAQRAGWRTVLVAGGVHGPALAGEQRFANLQALVVERGLARPPDAVLAELAW